MTVEGPDDEIVGVATLEEGSLNERGGCILPFVADDVEQVDFYQVRSRSTLRGGLTFTRRDLEDADWQMPLEVGDAAAAARESRADCLEATDVVATADLSVKPSTFGKDLHVDGQFFRYSVHGRVDNLTDIDVEATVDWEVTGWDALLSRNDVATDVFRESSLGAMDYNVVTIPSRGSVRFNASGVSHVGGLIGGPRPTQVNVSVRSVTRAGTAAAPWCELGQ